PPHPLLAGKTANDRFARTTETTPMKLYLKKFLFGQVTLIFALAWFALSPQARAACQEGCLTNANTVLGEDALISNTGAYNNAIGEHALINNTTGSENTATGSGTLFENTSGVGNTATGHFTLFYNSIGYYNKATGDCALN